ncbi:MAG: hypothetical protein JKY65_04650 [Planctomycetes bacterium]|nr:hypothetical protein [Planctomycetota bacterium]
MGVEESVRDLCRKALGRDLRESEGVSKEEVDQAAAGLGCALESSLRAYYRCAGRADTLNSFHNEILVPQDWYLSEGHLVFMEENQGVVSWGLKVDADEEATVWQRNNTSGAWHSEEKPLLVFLEDLFAWYAEGADFPPSVED